MIEMNDITLFREGDTRGYVVVDPLDSSCLMI